MAILSVTNLTKTFSSGVWPFTTKQQYTAVNDISLALKRGEILGFLGPNGAGKTTTIQMLLGTLTPTSGSIDYFGTSFARHRIAILKKVTYASGYDKLPTRLTIAENLDIVGRIYGMSASYRTERIKELLTFFDMWHMRNRATGSLSAGQATRVMLTKAFLPEPEIVLLDEPTASLDPDVAHDVRHFILKQQRDRNISILLTSHNMAEVSSVCNRVLVIKQGVLIADNTPEQLAKSVAKVRVNLVITQGKEQLITYAQKHSLAYKINEHSIEIEIDEHTIAAFLAHLAQQNVLYSQIAIDKPTLEDYFLSVVKK
jgi:ABC-2 type transport system ATP-binding protein